MSWQLTGLVSRKKWGGQTRRLLALTMADKANDDGSGVYASVRTLARDSEISEATARRTLKEFLDAGIIVKTGERPCLNGATNVYCLQPEIIEAMADLKPAKQADTPVTVRPVSRRTASSADTPVTPTPLSRRDQTPVTVTAKPIPEPSPSTLTTFELKPPPAAKARGAKKAPAYTPEFQMIWMAWPKHRRANSDKRKAFERYQTGVEQFGKDAITAAAKRYLSLPDTRKDQWRYCCLVEVFMNGKLEAAVEAALEAEMVAAETINGVDLHEADRDRAAKSFYAKHGRWPPTYKPPTEAARS